MEIKTKFRTKIKISITMIIFGIVWVVSGNGKVFLTVCLTVLLHEIFHGITAKILGLEVNEIVLYPFGGGINISGLDNFFEKEIIVALSAPLFSVFSGVLWQKCANARLLPQWDDFVSYSYAIGFFNMLPVYPLDGGRMFEGILCLMFKKKGKKINRIISLLFSVLFFAFCIIRVIFYSNFSYAVIGGFVLLSALLNLNVYDCSYRRADKSDKIGLIVAKKNEPLLKVYNRFYGDNYGIAVIIDEKGKIADFISEEEMLSILTKNSLAKA